MSGLMRHNSLSPNDELTTPEPNFFIAINISITTHGHTSSFNKEFEIFATSKLEAYQTAKRFCATYNVDDAPESSNASCRTSVVIVEEI